MRGRSEQRTMEFDDIVVGAGSSGAALAARLSENRSRTVLLLEAGPDYATAEEMPERLRKVNWLALGTHDWGFKALAVGERPIDYPRGKVVGGCSAINGAVALRGVPADYDEWGSEWSYDKCLPYFRKLEDDPDFVGPFHGQGGPIPLRRWKDEELVAPQRAFATACREAGFDFSPDINHPESTGLSPLALTREGELRYSTALGYLPAARRRSNFTLTAEAEVEHLLFEGGRATGLTFQQQGQSRTVRGERIFLCAGAIQTPAILWRSGVGPAAELARLGVSVLADLPVGHQLSDHPLAHLMFVPKEGVCDLNNPLVQYLLRFTSPGSDWPNDMQIMMTSHIDLNDLPELQKAVGGLPLVFTMSPGLQKPLSRGRVLLESLQAPPKIELNFFEHPEDLRRLREGLRLAWRLAQNRDFKELYEAVLMDPEVLGDDARLDEFLRQTSSTMFHPAGTCAMGSVVDHRGAVLGLEGLFVCDASIMPTLPRANTNLTCIMLAERMAEGV